MLDLTTIKTHAKSVAAKTTEIIELEKALEIIETSDAKISIYIYSEETRSSLKITLTKDGDGEGRKILKLISDSYRATIKAEKKNLKFMVIDYPKHLYED